MNENKQIMDYIIGIDREFKNRINKEFDKIGLTSSQARILGFITHNYKNKICSRDLEKHFDLSHPTVNGILKRLEAKEMIYFQSDDTDKRVKNLYITEKAQHLHENIRMLIQSNESAVISVFNKDEQENLKMLLGKMYSRLKEEEN